MSRRCPALLAPGLFQECLHGYTSLPEFRVVNILDCEYPMLLIEWGMKLFGFFARSAAVGLAPGGQIAGVIAATLGNHGAALRPRTLAADSLDWGINSSVRASAARSNSRHRAVRFSGSSVVDRIRWVSASSFLSTPSSVRFGSVRHGFTIRLAGMKSNRLLFSPQRKVSNITKSIIPKRKRPKF
jgi:hypothetical protein